jgi:hypothetical protein
MISCRQIPILLIGLAITIGAAAACRPEGERTVPAAESGLDTPALAEPSPTPPLLPPINLSTRSLTVTSPALTKPARLITVTVTPPPTSDPVGRARADLAERLGVGIERILVVHVQADEFPASNLGCPGKAAKPIPALVSGFEIVLAEGERQHVYRARKHTLVYCGPRP